MKKATGEFTLENEKILLQLQSETATVSVLDKRTGHTWRQEIAGREGTVESVAYKEGELHYTWHTSNLNVSTEIQLAPDRAEFTITLYGDGSLSDPLQFPHPFVTEPGTYLVVPMNEGISYPVEDETIAPMRLIAYGGHGICMAFWGVTDGEQGLMTLIETSDDAAVRIDRVNGKLYVAPEWDAQKGLFGYPRRLRYILFDQGGYVAFCKYYRQYAKEQGRFKTLAEKRAENSNVDKLVGAVNVWCWDKDPLPIVREMQDLGIARILWSDSQGADTISALNDLDVMTSTYDMYQDVMDPQKYDSLRSIHRRWPAAAWSDDLMLGPDGDWIKGWQITTKAGERYPCGVVCDRQAPPYAQERISEELKTLPYTCRFIDTTTATPWRECYHPDHPLTRGESREWKMELLRVISEDFNLVTGTETGHDAAVPYVHYFEGMLSLGPYRVPDAGRRMQQIWDEVPERVAKFQLGHRYRLPLWELVYHDCVIAHWYWGDYNNKLPALWDKRDLFNVLYGTVPMFMFDRELWQHENARFARSYRDTCTVARAVGYAEMTEHKFLTANRDVQQTTFANGVTIIVNFSDQAYELPNDVAVKPMGYVIKGLEPDIMITTS